MSVGSQYRNTNGADSARSAIMSEMPVTNEMRQAYIIAALALTDTVAAPVKRDYITETIAYAFAAHRESQLSGCLDVLRQRIYIAELAKLTGASMPLVNRDYPAYEPDPRD